MWGKAWKFAVAAFLVYLVLQLGVPTVLAFLDPGGSGGLLDRLPRVVRNLGLLAAGLGFVLALTKWGKEWGTHMIGYGALAIVAGIFGPTLVNWLTDNGPQGLDYFLASLNGVRLK